MPLYHFHLYDGVVVFDYRGHCVENDAAARVEAEAYLLRAETGSARHSQPFTVGVTNAAGTPLFHVGPEAT